MALVMNRLEVSAFFVDARAKPCPVPIIELAKALRSAPLVELWADDPAAEVDLRAFIAATGHGLEGLELTFGLRAVIRRAGSPPPPPPP